MTQSTLRPTDSQSAVIALTKPLADAITQHVGVANPHVAQFIEELVVYIVDYPKAGLAELSEAAVRICHEIADDAVLETQEYLDDLLHLLGEAYEALGWPRYDSDTGKLYQVVELKKPAPVAL